MESVFIIVVVLVAFFFLVQKRAAKQVPLKESQYKLKGSLLNNNESVFYNALVAAVANNGVVMPKVAMSQVIGPKSGNKKQWFIANNRIARSYFDYVICDPRTFEPRVVIELDNGKELDKGKIERQKLIIHVCKTANLPLIGCHIKHSYQVGRLRRLLATHIELIEPEKEVRFCKRCGSPMVIKVAAQGEFKGRKFFTCSRQPHCTYTENYNVVFEEDDEL
ncbi:Topoisomerase DNA binding C4 zinc finger [Vibrio xiamenensis]|uniref:Topoisomerase DNA binding C4 zinc finger n=1 Tax=Vibrio xiamenensis TaxID=861298 RepID=A0A1G8E2C5_9VIBR|nr:DUF2726 domain-containing protein [Vibrio xiamenensis]SDH64005.1 Topoisomerase DNA binding C4 zinc finger [Vibrio xiamenensis]